MIDNVDHIDLITKFMPSRHDSRHVLIINHYHESHKHSAIKRDSIELIDVIDMIDVIDVIDWIDLVSVCPLGVVLRKFLTNDS